MPCWHRQFKCHGGYRNLVAIADSPTPCWYHRCTCRCEHRLRITVDSRVSVGADALLASSIQKQMWVATPCWHRRFKSRCGYRRLVGAAESPMPCWHCRYTCSGGYQRLVGITDSRVSVGTLPTNALLVSPIHVSLLILCLACVNCAY